MEEFLKIGLLLAFLAAIVLILIYIFIHRRSGKDSKKIKKDFFMSMLPAGYKRKRRKPDG